MAMAAYLSMYAALLILSCPNKIKGRNNQKIDKTTITPYRLQTIQMYL